MVQNRKIKITYLIVVVFLCVLGVSGAFQAIFEFWPLEAQKSLETPQKHPSNLNFSILDHFQAIYGIELNSHTKSYKSHPKLGPPVRWHTGLWLSYETAIVCQYYSLRGLRKHRLCFLVLPKTLWFIDLPCVVPQPDPRSGWVGHVACCAALIHCTVWLMSWRKRISQAKGKVWFQLFKALIKLNPGSNLILVSISWPTNKRF